VLAAAVENQRPAARTLLERAWGSRTFADCPRLAEWTTVLEGISWEPFSPLELQPPKALVTWGPAGPLPQVQAQEPVRWERHTAPPPSGPGRQIFEWAPHPAAAPDPKAPALSEKGLHGTLKP